MLQKRNGIFSNVDRSRVFCILDYIEKVVINTEKVIYISGNTRINIQEIKNLENTLDVSVISSHSGRVGWLWFLPIPFNNDFLIKVINKNNIKQVCKTFENHDLVTIYIFNQEHEISFIKDFKDKNSIYYDKEYLIYGIDFDSEDSSMKIIEYVSYGEDISQHMKEVLELYSIG